MSEMSELTLTIIRLGFLAVLWLFVLTAVSVMRSDLFGRRVAPRPAARPAAPAPRATRPPKPVKGRRGEPSVLVVTQGALAGTSVRLGQAPVTLGRAQDSTIVLDDDYVSTHHARLFPQDGQWLVEDLGSTNGTWLNRHKVSGPMVLQRGDRLQIGNTVMELR